MKGMINIKNNDNKCFLCCHIRHLRTLKTHAERITKAIQKWLILSIMKVLNFLLMKTILVELNRKIIFALMYFALMYFGLIYPVYVLN